MQGCSGRAIQAEMKAQACPLSGLTPPLARRISAHPGEVRISSGLYFMTPHGGALFEAGQPTNA
ncbi:MAG: hypothetical protein CFE33_00110 [Pseudorhodobacter sp. PARRP1]|nr:MAG: hypothetical protein CFE33_00110 [Pseudorhodobacter sp. PARRP1]